MPFSYVIDVEHNVIRETYTGDVQLEELYEMCRQQWRDPLYRPGLNMLTDFRSARMQITYDEMQAFAVFIGRQESVQRHAIVVGREVGYGLARMFTALSEATSPYWDSLRVFFNFDDANHWVMTGVQCPVRAAPHAT